MAKLRSGILGNIRGKVAGVVGGQWKNVNYVREYVKPANPNTALQQTQRTKMSDVVAFAKSCVGSVFNAYTDRFQKAMSGFNFFIKQNISLFDGSPDYSAVVLTEGKLKAAPMSAAVFDGGSLFATLTFSTELGNNGANDDVIFAGVYNSDTGVWTFAAAEVERDTGTIDVDDIPSADPSDLHAYLWAARKNGNIVEEISNSSYHTIVAA